MKSIKVEWNDDIIYKPLQVYETKLYSDKGIIIRSKLQHRLYWKLQTNIHNIIFHRSNADIREPFFVNDDWELLRDLGIIIITNNLKI